MEPSNEIPKSSDSTVAEERAYRPRYWFPAKRHGFGWGPPIRLQGWLVLFAYIAALGYAGIVHQPDREPGVFAVWVVAATLAYLGMCWWKGAPPRWRRGKR